jgi:hypothetical protein
MGTPGVGDFWITSTLGMVGRFFPVFDLGESERKLTNLDKMPIFVKLN